MTLQTADCRNRHFTFRMRHQRNVVSALGHFLTFTISISQHVFTMTGFILFPDSVEEIGRFWFFVVPCIHFCLCPLIETLSSQTLRDSLLYW